MIKVVILLSQVGSNNNKSSPPPLPNHSKVHFLKNLINVIYLVLKLLLLLFDVRPFFIYTWVHCTRQNY